MLPRLSALEATERIVKYCIHGGLSLCYSIVKDRMRCAGRPRGLRLDYCRLVGLWMTRLDVTWWRLFLGRDGSRPTIECPV
jgi:hypothetical protein